MFYFENDYCEGAHPAILQKLMETNFEKVSGYGTDPYCASAREKIRAACACPEADVTFISGGTQTNALDPETIQEVLDVMIRLAKENITMVIVTHEMGFARQVADRMIFMADGMILEEGTPDQFFENPTNERLKQFLGKIIRK